MKKILYLTSTSIYLIMCTLFTILLYMYFSDMLLTGHKSWPVCISLITLIVIADYLSRKYLKNLIVFFLVHILFMIAAIFIPFNLTDKILLGIISLGFLLMAINFWKTDVNERSRVVIDIPFAGIAAFIIIYIHSSYSLSAVLNSFAYIGGISFFLLFFIREYIDKFLSYSLSSQNFSNEMKKTFTTNLSFIALFNIIVIFLITVINLFFSDKSFNVIGKFFKSSARHLFSCLSHLEGKDEAYVEMVTTEIETVNENPVTVYANNSMSGGKNIGNMIFSVLQVVVFIGIAVGIIFIIYSFIKQYMQRNHNINDEVKSTKDVTSKRSYSVKPKDSSLKSILFKSNSDKIRRIYLNRVNQIVKRNSRIIIRKSYTADQINSSVTKDERISKNNMEYLTFLYQKARYSNSEITKEDVENAKNTIIQ